MPAPGDQHTSLVNPFELAPQRISEWTAEEAATLQARLEKQLGPEYLSTRPGPSGQRLTYIGAEKIIALANEVFGFNGWSSCIRDAKIDYYEEEKSSGKISIGVSVIVRVTLRDGTYHEDVGFGHVENNRNRAQCYEKAKKEGTTDALKRALRQFGNLLGLCVYDKAYVSKVSKVKAVPVKFDENALHRHPDFVVKNEPSGMIKEEKTGLPAQQPPSLRPPQLPNLDSFEDFLGELDEADFSISDEGQPDEIILPNSTETDSTIGNVSNNSHDQAGNAGVHNQAGNIGNHGGSAGNNAMHPPARQLARATSAGNNPPRQMPQTPVQQAPRPNINQFPGAGAQNRGPPMNGRPPQQSNQNRPAPQPTHAKQNGVQNQNPHVHMTTPQASNNDNSTTGAPPGDESLAFFSARAVKTLPEDVLKSGKLTLKPGQAFNPHFESSSIPRTPGVDHSASKPLSKSLQHVPARKTEETETLLGTSVAAPRATVGGGSGVGNAAGNARSALGAGLAAAPKPANVINPQLDQTRRIGAPVSSSPLGNRGQFRPLTVKRPAAGADGPNGAGGGATNGNGVAAAATAGRVPLADVSSNALVGPGINGAAGGVGTGPEAKRQRVS
ncbi:hypothetical protein C7999DRAFT_27812 [Corynascus novoguineensis]|uniref:RAD52 homolog n=1 Tax=Corynascus novoguineensis TaxID=1126955 RepID=A0AAN7HUH7_9PEZI|nr:hypothetical protein C7999DRAFT_27812 [Corynascus novoguineensis]